MILLTKPKALCAYHVEQGRTLLTELVYCSVPVINIIIALVLFALLATPVASAVMEDYQIIVYNASKA